MRKISTVWTPSGRTTGPVNSLVGKGESLINYNTGNATLVTKGKVGVDNQPSSITSGDDNVIAGNDKDWAGYFSGNTSSISPSGEPVSFANQVAPITARIQKINALEGKFRSNMKKSDLDSMAKQTQQLFNQNVNTVKSPLMSAAKDITDRQQEQHEMEKRYRYIGNTYNKGKGCLERFNGGDGPALSDPVPYALRRRIESYAQPKYDNITWNFDLDDVPVIAKAKPNIPAQALHDKTVDLLENPTAGFVRPKIKIDTPKPVKPPKDKKRGSGWFDKLRNIKGDGFIRTATEAIPIGINALQANYWRNQKVHTPDIYAGNPYERTALNTLAGLRINPYAITRELRDSERRNAYAISRAGGLSGAQKYLALAGQSLGTQNNIAKALFDAQQQNNQYVSNYAGSLLNAGNAEASRRMQANQYANEAYDRAASRRASNYWKSMQGVSTAAQQAYANEFKYRNYKDMMNLYNRELDLKQKEILNNYAKGG